MPQPNSSDVPLNHTKKVQLDKINCVYNMKYLVKCQDIYGETKWALNATIANQKKCGITNHRYICTKQFLQTQIQPRIWPYQVSGLISQDIGQLTQLWTG